MVLSGHTPKPAPGCGLPLCCTPSQHCACPHTPPTHTQPVVSLPPLPPTHTPRCGPARTPLPPTQLWAVFSLYPVPRSPPPPVCRQCNHITMLPLAATPLVCQVRCGAAHQAADVQLCGLQRSGHSAPPLRITPAQVRPGGHLAPPSRVGYCGTVCTSYPSPAPSCCQGSTTSPISDHGC